MIDPPAKGYMHRGRKRILVDIDPEDFDRIASTPLPGCNSMSAKVRLLIEWGMEAAEELKEPVE